MATADDTARLLVSIEATQKQFSKQLERIARDSAKAAGKVEKDFQQANDNVGKSHERAGRKAKDSVRQTSAAVSNLSFQLNDIATSLAGGASPFQVMFQQGSQVAQALGSAGGGLGGALRALGGAAASLVNPVSLASFAFVGLTGALVQYLTTLKSDAPDATELLKQHGEVIKAFDEAYGIAEEGVKRYSAEVQKIRLQQLRDQFGSLSEAAEQTADALRDQLLSIPKDDFGGLTKTISDFQSALALLDQEIPDFRGFSVALQEIENNTRLPDNVRALAKELRASADASIELQSELEKTRDRLGAVRLSGEEAKQAFVALTAAATGMGEQGGNAILSIAGNIRDNLLPAIGDAIQKAGEFASNLAKLQDQVNLSPLGTLSPLVSGGGQFLDPMQQQDFNFNQNRYREAGESAAAEMIRGFEGFITKAKWDVNAFRVGFGSDTVTRANGMIEKVTKDTVVTLADAERDLSRRLLEFQSGIQDAIGVDTWNALNEAQKAALSSIAYNYGSLPDSIVEAIEGNGGPQAVAQAIARLTSNPGRRQQEAQAFLSGSGISMASAGLSGRTPQDLFAGDMAQIQQRIDLLNAEYNARSQLNPLIEDYGYALEKAKIEQQLLSEAQRAGVEITPQLRDSISQLAENYAKASANSEQLRASQQRLTATAQEFRSLGKDVVGGFVRDLRNGTSAADALANALDKVVDKLIDMALNSFFDGSGGDFFSGLFSGFGGGGLSGLTWDSWSKGGYTGDGGKYQPAGVVHKGEYVFDADSTRRIGAKNLARLAGYAKGGLVGGKVSASGAAGSPVSISIINNSSAKITEKRTENAGGVDLKLIIDDVMAENLSTPGTASARSLATKGIKPALARR